MPVNFKGGLLVNGENVTTETVVETLQEELNTKAVLGAFNGGGTGVDYADLATNLRTEQGANVEDAIAQLSPISVAVEDGDFAEMTNVKGRSFAYNQLMSSIDSVNWQASGGTVVKNNNIINLTTTTTSNQEIYAFTPSGSIKNGNKYLCFVEIKSPRVSNCRFTIAESNWSSYNSATTENNNNVNAWSSMAAIINIDHSFSGAVIHIYPLNSASNDEVGDELQFRNVQIFNLTAMGLASVATVEEAYAALRAHGVEPTVYNEYSAGKIRNSQPNKIISRGFNQFNFDEFVELYPTAVSKQDNEYTIDTTKSQALYNTGVPTNILNEFGLYITFEAKNGTAVNPRIRIIFEDGSGQIITISGSSWTKYESSLYGTHGHITSVTLDWSTAGIFYVRNFCINVSNPSLNGTYKPFVKDEHALTLPVMRSAGSVADDKEMVRVGTVDLGTLSWSEYDANTKIWVATNNNYKPLTDANKPLLYGICSKYVTKNKDTIGETEDKTINLGHNYYQIVIKDTSYTDAAAFKAAMSGVMLNYELATPAPQDPAINLPQNIKVYNGGTLETQYESPNTTPALVSMLYQVNLKNFVEGVGSKEDINWDPQNVASKADVDKKANTEDIKSGALIARLADDLTPYGEDSGAEQTNPFIINGTGTNNNTEIVTVGTYAFLKEKQGNTEKSENVIVTADRTMTTNTITCDIKGGRALLNGSSENETNFWIPIETIPSGTPISFKDFGDMLSFPTNSIQAYLVTRVSGYDDRFALSNNNRFYSGTTEHDYKYLHIFVQRNTTLTNVKLYPMLGRGLTTPTTWSQGYEGLKTSDGVKLISTGRNIWDEEWEVGTINYVTGDNNDAQTRIRSKNYIQAIPNKTFYQNYNTTGRQIQVFYYDKNHNFLGYENSFTQALQGLFTTPSNCYYIRFIVASDYGTTYKNDITITPYYTPAQGGEGYDQYYPHEEPHVIDTGTEVLRSAGKKKDIKLPSGLITRKVSNITITSVQNGASLTNVYRGAVDLTGLPISITTEQNSSLKVSGAVIDRGVVQSESFTPTVLSVSTYTGASYLYICAPNCTTREQLNAYLAEHPIEINYDLVETAYTTEQGTAFNESVSINDYGMLYWLDENDELVGIPQGAKIFYPVNYKGFMDDMYSRVDGDSSAFVTHDNIPINEIKDSYGRLRFVEISGGSGTLEGLTITYRKASLSGTHLMCVVAGDITAGTTVSDGFRLASWTVPAYIYDKIQPVFNSNIEIKHVTLYSTDWTTTTTPITFRKDSNNIIGIYKTAGAVSISKNCSFRIQCDLLIDLDE